MMFTCSCCGCEYRIEYLHTCDNCDSHICVECINDNSLCDDCFSEMNEEDELGW